MSGSTAADPSEGSADYLHDLLVKLSDGWLMSRLDELLPGNWKPGLA